MLRWTCLALACLSSLACAVPPPRSPSPPAAPAVAAPAAPSPAAAPAAGAPAAASEPAARPTLIIEGPPAPPAELRARLRQYLETRSAVVDSITADGKSLLVRTRFADTAQLHFVKSPLGARRQLTFEGEPIAGGRLVPGDASALWFARDLGGNEDYQLYRLDLKSGRAALLTDGKSRHEGLLVERGGKRIAYAGNGRNGRDMDIYVADGTNPDSARRVLEVQGSYAPLDFSRDGTRLLVRHTVSILESHLYVVELASGKAQRITPPDVKASHRIGFFDVTGTRVYTSSDREGEMIELYEVELGAAGAGTFRPLSRDIPWNVEHADLSPDGRTLAFVTNEEGYGVLHLLDTRTRKHRLAKGLPRAILGGLRYAESADVLGLSLAQPTSATDAYTYDVKRGQLTRFTESEMGGLDAGSFVAPELVRVKSFDGLSVPAFLYKPRGQGPFPVLIDIHGGPESQARPGFHPLAQYLTRESGIAVLVPNVRGSDGYGKTYLALDNERKREDSVKDIGAFLDWIAAEPSLDEKRVAVTGGSYGGYMVLACLVHHGSRLLGGIDVVGIANFVTFLENTRDYRRDLRRVEYGDESNPEMRAFLREISPLTHVDRINSALLVGHGTNDPRVPVSEAEQIISAVRGRGREVWSVVATNEGHGFQKKENRDRFTEISVMFLERILGRDGAR
jgi:dipeptidyl aminopeptidase/acylaminoacyl peptidase